MKHFTPEQKKLLTNAFKDNTVLRDVFIHWLNMELSQLIKSTDNPNVYQGRCQVLEEIVATIDTLTRPNTEG